MIFHMVCIDEITRAVHFGMEFDDPTDGPARPFMPAPGGTVYEQVQEPFVRLDLGPTVLPFLAAGAVQWVETAGIDDQRAAKNDEINAAWIAADSAAFQYAGEQFRAGADDVLRLNSINGYISLMNAMPPDWIGVWKTMGDTFIALPDVDSWKPFYTAFVIKGVTNYLAAQGLKAQLAAATTAAEIAAIHWPE